MAEDSGGGSGGKAQGIRVFARLRPTRRISKWLSVAKNDDEEKDDALVFDIPAKEYREGQLSAGIEVNNSATRYTFRFPHGRLLPMKVSQEDVFSTIAEECADDALAGVNATIFAYGQTGSGKTFSMTGGTARYSERGIIPRTLSHIFAQVEKRPQEIFEIRVSFLEIYNERGFDLLDPAHSADDGEGLRRVTIVEDDVGGVHCRNLSQHLVTTEEDALSLLFLGDTNRAVAQTAMNMNSSRSHCIFTIALQCRAAGGEDTGMIKHSKLHLVDLAGSERVAKTHSQGQTLREAKAINVSLHYLEMVIVALQKRSRGDKKVQHIPYRNAMLTSVLRDSLGGNCRTTMLATLAVTSSHLRESISTCRFAQRVAMVKNSARINESLDPKLALKQQKAENMALREELMLLRDAAGAGEAQEVMTKEKLLRLKHKVVAYLDDGRNDSVVALGRITATRVRAAFRFCKELYISAVKSGGRRKRRGSAIEDGGGGASTAREEELEEEVARLRRELEQKEADMRTLSVLAQGDRKIKAGRSSSSSSRRRGGGPEDEVDEEQEQDADVGLRAGLDAEGKVLDKAEAFRAFEQTGGAELSGALRGNKKDLKLLIRKAKALGDEVNTARARIKALKREIEQDRVRTAMDGGESESASPREGEGAKAAAPSDAERRMVEEMGRCKTVYQSGFLKLKRVKKEIVGIQSTMQRTRKRLRKDFDGWYRRVEELSQKKKTEKEEDGGAGARRSGDGGRDSAAPPAKARAAWGDGGSAGAVDGTGLDDDIQAFYKARDELMKRRAGQQ